MKRKEEKRKVGSEERGGEREREREKEERTYVWRTFAKLPLFGWKIAYH